MKTKTPMFNVIVMFPSARLDAFAALKWGACHISWPPVEGEDNGQMVKLITYQFDSEARRDFFVERVKKSVSDDLFEFEFSTSYTWRKPKIE